MSAVFRNLQLKDIDFDVDDLLLDLNINLNLDDEIKNVSPLSLEEPEDDDKYTEYIGKELEKRLINEIEQSESDEDEQQKETDSERRRMIIELFGEDTNESDVSESELSERESELKERESDVLPEIRRSEKQMMQLVDSSRGFGKRSDTELLKELNEELATEDQLELTPIETKKKIGRLLKEEMSRDEIMKIIPGKSDMKKMYIEEVMEDREKYPLSDEFVESEPESETAEGRIVSPSFDEKLKSIKEEIEQIDKNGKKKIIKAKTKKDTKAKKEKVECPQGKELNPKTGKCVNVCKPGYKRNPETFKCEKEKAVKRSKKTSAKTK